MLLLLFSRPPTVTPPATSSNLGLSGLQGRKNATLTEKGTPIETFAYSDRCSVAAATCIVVGDRWGLPCGLWGSKYNDFLVVGGMWLF
jgi:hypothetical protein